MSINKKQFWNNAYKQGFDYRLISEGEIRRILELVPEEVSSVLDIGCGTGDAARKLATEGLKVTGIDMSDIAIKQAESKPAQNIEYKVFDFEKDDIRQLGTFDLVLCKLVLAFVDDKPAFIDSVADVLESGGLLVIINPVVTNPSPQMPKKLSKISVEDNVTNSLLEERFDLIDVSSEKASAYHDIVTYIARLRQTPKRRVSFRRLLY